ncbi:hypothetical protein AAGG74_16490 [Bacillus mexicanus]|uniref:hypothetical protein n=1 Tax=Bacillus mexicanus TaxID=2834415 RepID=UPI003D243E99
MDNNIKYRVAKNYNEYLEICKETFLGSEGNDSVFQEPDSWFDFFGIYQFRDEKYDDVDNWEDIISGFNGEMDLKPDEEEFPVLVTYCFDSGFDRLGDMNIQMWDMISLKELNLRPY